MREFIRIPVQPEDKHLRTFGYAPGGYMFRCRDCRDIAHNVDKHSWVCRDCAVNQYKNTIEEWAGIMTYDNWKATNPADDELGGPESDEEIERRTNYKNSRVNRMTKKREIRSLIS